ncbi:unnamed protein product [Phytophthora fragariaefolia]|uniref:Unnamed protein product n=1 Tax=Phytophthora fragariaefolia TaxID=1490495 RepID=A0A9W6YE17_9STRA|nr:unnamed protein product [Phytophthora fragariaefolia]
MGAALTSSSDGSCDGTSSSANGSKISSASSAGAPHEYELVDRVVKVVDRTIDPHALVPVPGRHQQNTRNPVRVATRIPLVHRFQGLPNGTAVLTTGSSLG